jgi:hypothetical protein
MNAARHQPIDGGLQGLDDDGNAATWLAQLVEAGADALPLPGAGATLARWRALAAVGAHDLALAKLFEGHTDALAILHELGQQALGTNRSIWGVWAAEAPEGRTTFDDAGAGRVVLRGAKCWCSGAVSATHALLTAWDAQGAGPQLVAIEIGQPGVAVDAQAWQAVGMADSASLDVRFDSVRGIKVGRPGDYLSRPGFWQGGAGIAACWYGAAARLAEQARDAAARGPAPPPALRAASLGRIDVALSAAAAMLREAAAWIDRHPHDDARGATLRVRLAVEASATAVLNETGRMLGATPYCRDARFARRAADLPVFMRQSHGDRDLASLGESVAVTEHDRWTL